MRLNRFPLQYVFGALCIVWFFVSSSAYSDFVANLIRGVGVALVIAGVYGRLYATIFIGSVKNEGVDGESFIDYGAYSLCRNPLYLFSFIYLWIYKMTILSEEEFLESKFGEPYKQFLQKTSRFFPRFKGFHCPEKIEVCPEFLHKEIRRALNWFLGVVVILAIEMLQYYEIMPVFWRIY